MKLILVYLFTLVRHEVTPIRTDLGPMERNDNLKNVESDFIAGKWVYFNLYCVVFCEVFNLIVG